MEAESAYVRGRLDLAMMTGRYSSGLVTELKRHVEKRSENIFPILDEIGCLEGVPNAGPTRTKAAAPLIENPRLSGLWHKHYLQAAFIPENLHIHWGRKRLFGRVKTIMRDQTVPFGKKAEALSHAVIDGYRERRESQKITGQWIVFAPHQGMNYYLTLGIHGEDEAIRNRALACCGEFPHLDICR